jgi:hypothetical protein
MSGAEAKKKKKEVRALATSTGGGGGDKASKVRGAGSWARWWSHAACPPPPGLAGALQVIVGPPRLPLWPPPLPATGGQ